MHSMKDEIPVESVQRLIEALNKEKRSASEIARLTGVSQPTVSRMRASAGRRMRRSTSFNKLCNFYEIPLAVVGKGSHRYNELLRDAVIDAWDGSETHGQALLVVLKGLKGLQAPTRGNAGD